MKSEDRGIKKAKAKGGLVKGKEIRVTEDEVFRMNGGELDDYMDWYQRTFVDGDDEDAKSEFFPCFLIIFHSLLPLSVCPFSHTTGKKKSALLFKLLVIRLVIEKANR